ncbi:hypothetical protein ACG3SL_00165 [Sphingomonas sp. CJ20]
MRFFQMFGWKPTLALIVATVVYIFVGAWLSHQLNWPDQYGLHCRGRGCLFTELYHSPALLRGGRWQEYLLFGWFWFLPVIAIAALSFGLWDARRRSRGLVYPSK